MNKDLKVTSLYFSPTGNTRKIIQQMAKNISQNKANEINFAPLKGRESFSDYFYSVFGETDLFLIGSPVYSGKIPLLAKKTIEKINGDGKRTICLVTYGNKNYGIAVKELVEILTQRGFKVIAAAAFVGEHSFSSLFPIAINRPDKSDMQKATDFCENLLQNKPHTYSNSFDKSKIDFLSKIFPDDGPVPFLLPEKCSHCGLCVSLCTMGIIDKYTKEFESKESEKKCIGCMACVKGCPNGAREFQLLMPVKQILKLYFKSATSLRQEPQLWKLSDD